jgi:hypothetical protein
MTNLLFRVIPVPIYIGKRGGISNYHEIPRRFASLGMTRTEQLSSLCHTQILSGNY